MPAFVLIFWRQRVPDLDKRCRRLLQGSQSKMNNYSWFHLSITLGTIITIKNMLILYNEGSNLILRVLISLKRTDFKIDIVIKIIIELFKTKFYINEGSFIYIIFLSTWSYVWFKSTYHNINYWHNCKIRKIVISDSHDLIFLTIIFFLVRQQQLSSMNHHTQFRTHRPDWQEP